jgi:hypothetical protein
MAFNISEFSSQVNTRGVAQTNLFYVRIILNPSLSFLDENFPSRELSFFCRAVALPDIAVGATPFKPKGFGPSEQRPTTFDYAPINTGFLVDSEFGVQKFFHRWMQEIVNYDVSGGYFSESPSALLPFEFGYKDEYACSMEVIQYSGPTENKFYTYKFGNVYPISIGSINLSWENAAEAMTLPVTFAFDELTVDGTVQGTVTGGARGVNGILSFLSSLNTIGQAVSNIRKPRNIQDAINQFTNINTILGSL